MTPNKDSNTDSTPPFNYGLTGGEQYLDKDVDSSLQDSNFKQLSSNKDSLREAFIEIADKHFPKGDKGRGCAMVLIAEALIIATSHIEEARIDELERTISYFDDEGRESKNVLKAFKNNRIKELKSQKGGK